MSDIQALITEHLAIWTGADNEKKSGRGRASGSAASVYGVKKLRELILELAVRGKLVPQEASDEPASELLKRIAAEKAKLIKEGKIKAQKPLAVIGDDEKPFDLPEHWEWCRFGDLVNISTGALDANAAVDNGEYPFFTCSQTPSRIDAYSYDTSAVLLAGNGDFNVKCYQGKFDAYQRTYVIEPIVFGLKFCFLLVSAQIKEITKNNRGSAIPYLKIGDLTNPVFALPPLAEQHRIVAKVDELMTLCDQLENQHSNAIVAHEKLVSYLLNTLTQSQNTAEFNESWQRIAANFDTLFSTESSIDALKQTILELAVIGKLSYPQQGDTSIESLLDKIINEKRMLGLSKKEEDALRVDVSISLEAMKNNRVLLKARSFCGFITKGTTPAQSELLIDGAVPFLKVYNIVNNQLDFDYRPIFISKDVHNTKLSRSKLYPADVIMNIVGPPLGKVAIISNKYPEWNMNQALAVFRPVSGIYNRYIFHMLTAKSVLKSVLAEVKGTAGQDNLSLEQCRELLIPIPSTEEQHRIVAKVDELMAICDQLKTRITIANQLQQKLADVIVAQAIN